jgi:hypothetical protein
MKKTLNVILTVMAAFAIVFLASCTDFTDTPGKSVWSEGLWILPWLTGIGSAIFFYQAYKGSKSGSIVKVPDPERPNVPGATIDQESDQNVPIYKFGQFYFGVVLLIVTVFIIWNTISNR